MAVSFYGIFSFIWLCAGALFVSRNIENKALNTKAKKINFILSGIFSSMLMGFFACELGLYLGLPDNLSGALGGVAGYIGANTISDLILSYLKKSLDKELDLKDETKEDK